MEFIFKTQLLSFDHQPSKAQYYLWQGKNSYKQLEKMEAQLNNRLINIINEEKRPKCQNRSSSDWDQFYENNIQWKKNIELKNQQQFFQLKSERQQAEQEAMRPKVKQSHTFIQNYSGPVSGWADRFKNYLKSRSNANLLVSNKNIKINQDYFQTAKKSQIGPKVQQRLLKYGQFVKAKRDLSNRIPDQPKMSVSESNQLYSRLHKQAEEITRRKSRIQPIYTFNPTITSLSPQTQSRVEARRKPLHQISRQSFVDSTDKHKQSTDSAYSKSSSFSHFIERNNQLIKAREKAAEEYTKQKIEKQLLQEAQCTFKPLLLSNVYKEARNTKSAIKINAKSKNIVPIAKESNSSCQNKLNLQYQTHKFDDSCHNSRTFVTKNPKPDLKNRIKLEENKKYEQKKQQSNCWLAQLDEVSQRIKQVLDK